MALQALAVVSASAAEPRLRIPENPRPDLENVRYGAHERNGLDLWKAKSTTRTPLVLYFHGGGFRRGDKSQIDAEMVNECLAAGYSVASVNYRYSETAPAPAAYLDGARAIQFFRHYAKDFNVSPELIAATGSSAGAGISLWIGFHEDLADPGSADPISRQSTRLYCLAVVNGKASYDPRYAERIGMPRPNLERHHFFFPFYAIAPEEIDSPKAYRKYEEFSAISHLTKDDPPVLMHYTHPNEGVTPETSLNLIMHHPKFGLALKERMDALGIECLVQYKGQSGPPQITLVDFIRKHFEAVRAKRAAELAARPPPPKPDFANIRYGPHERNGFDLWLAKSAEPAPLVRFIHGGGFRQGDKSGFGSKSHRRLQTYLAAGFAVAAVNYRLTDTAPAPAAYLDCARALQHLRHQAKEWNLDPKRVAATGGSAGAGTSLWIAFHDNLADPNSPDPIARQSTRLSCVAVENAQSSYDPRFAEKIGIARPNFEEHVFFLPFYGITAGEIDTPKAYRLYEAAAPITYLTPDDPPVLLNYEYANELNDSLPLSHKVHHPRFGLALQERMAALGIECIVQYPGNSDQRPIAEVEVEFLRKHFALAKPGQRRSGAAKRRRRDEPQFRKGTMESPAPRTRSALGARTFRPLLGVLHGSGDALVGKRVCKGFGLPAGGPRSQEAAVYCEFSIRPR